MNNPLQMNNWEIKKFLRLVLGIQLAMLGLVGLAALGFDIPVLRQLIGFLYLTFIPGLLILRIFKLHKLGSVETLLYSVGLSIAFAMFLGFFMNLFYPFVGIPNPISTFPLITTWTVVIGIFCFVAYKRDKGFFAPAQLNLGELLSPPVLFLFLLPLLAILGTQLANFYQNNIVLLVLIGLIAFTVILVVFTKFIPVKLYPLAVFSIALTLLWHYSLISPYLTGHDIFSEYYFFRLVNDGGFWNSALPNSLNAMLSITILPATLSQVLSLDGTQIFKIIYPLVFALVPLGLYQVYYEQLGGKRAFLSSFFLMSIYVFYWIMPSHARQEVAELFYVLLILLVVGKKGALFQRRALIIIFGTALIVSHYAVSYLFVVLLLVSLATLYLMKMKSDNLRGTFPLLFVVMCSAWYLYTASSTTFAAIVYIGRHIYENFTIAFLDPSTRELIYFAMASPPDALMRVNQILYYIVIFFIVVGGIRLILHRYNKELYAEYTALSIGNFILLGIAAVIPFFAAQITVFRLFQVASLVLAPFCILGAEAVFNLIYKTLHPAMRFYSLTTGRNILLTTILVLFLLFNIGFPHEVARNNRLTSIPLSLDTAEKYVGLYNEISLRGLCPTREEVFCAEWLSKHAGDKQIYATYLDIRVPALQSYGMISRERVLPLIPTTTVERVRGTYIYLGYVNTIFNSGTTNWRVTPAAKEEETVWDISEISPLLNHSIKVYSNGASEVYWAP